MVTEVYNKLSEEAKLLRLNEFIENPCFSHFLETLKESSEECEAMILGVCPKDMFEMNNREQMIGEVHGLARLTAIVKLEKQRLEKELHINEQYGTELPIDDGREL